MQVMFSFEYFPSDFWTLAGQPGPWLTSGAALQLGGDKNLAFRKGFLQSFCTLHLQDAPQTAPQKKPKLIPDNPSSLVAVEVCVCVWGGGGIRHPFLRKAAALRTAKLAGWRPCRFVGMFAISLTNFKRRPWCVK